MNEARIYTAVKLTPSERQLLEALRTKMGAPSLSDAVRVAVRTAATAHGLKDGPAPAAQAAESRKAA